MAKWKSEESYDGWSLCSGNKRLGFFGSCAEECQQAEREHNFFLLMIQELEETAEWLDERANHLVNLTGLEESRVMKKAFGEEAEKLRDRAAKIRQTVSGNKP